MLIQNILYYDEAGAGLIPLIFPSADESNIPESDTVYGDLEVDGLRPLISNRLIAETRYQDRTLEDTGGRNFVPTGDLTR